MKRKLMSVLMAGILLLSCLSCSNTGSADEAGKDTPVNSQDASSVDPALEEEEPDDGKTDYFNKMEPVDYDGWTLHIANDGIGGTYYNGFCVEELTGDEFNDAQFNRAIAVQDKYNIVLEENNNGSVNQIKNSVTAGTGDVGFGYVIGRSNMQLITGHFVKAMSDMPVIDMTRPYWDQGALKTLTFFGKMFYGYCDISWDHYESMALLFYNGALLTDNGLDSSPYDLYMEGKWTLDNMYNMVTAVSKDLNGDGTMNVRNDLYGFSGREFEYLPSLYSSGLRLITYDPDEETFIMDITQENIMAVGDMLNKIILDKSLSSPGGSDENRNLFKADRCLFHSQLLGDFRNLRDKENDYGIICYPALEENSEEMVYVQNPYAVMVPSDCSETERLGTIIEALAAYTYDNILDLYINRAVIGKGTRDEESANLLRKFISVRAFDLCYALDSSGPIQAYGVGVVNGNYSSAQQRQGKAFSKSMTKVVKALRGE